MKRKRVCKHCHRLFVPIRNPQQQFCSQRLCQNVRKSSWRREKQKHDLDYRENQNQACKKWRKKNPHYWKQYRATHSRYTETNRSRQKQRRAVLYKGSGLVSPGEASLFANSDALTQNTLVKAGTYKLVPVPSPEFANSDALIVNISIIPNSYRQTGEGCKHTTL